MRHCAPDPDGPGPITGADVANEDVRQLCLWHKYAMANNVLTDGLYSPQWWEYVTVVYEHCPWQDPFPADRFGSEACSYKLMRDLLVNTNMIATCVKESANQLLEESANTQAWSEFALRINGWRYRGPLDPELVLKAICASYLRPESVCEELLGGPISNTFLLLRHRVFKSLSVHTFEWLIGCICILSVINCFLYRRHIKKLVARQMREEVMLEVQSQMADYAKLQGDSL